MFKYKIQYSLPTSLMLNVTDDCNLQCKYCFVEQHPHYMELDTAKQAINYIYNNCVQRNLLEKTSYQPFVNFFGGEPMLLYKKIIVPIVEYTEEKYPNMFHFGITTNCTLLTKESIDFFVEHNIGILCSIDGAEQTQCYNRPCKNGDNSSKLIEKNIFYLLEKKPDVHFRCTAYPPTIQYLFENFLYAEKLGFKYFSCCIDETCHWKKHDIQIFKEQINKIFLYQIKNNSKIQWSSYYPIDNYINDLIIKNYNFQKDTFIRCGLGVTACAVGWDGKIYGCQQDVSHQKKNKLYIGDIVNGINQKKQKKILKKYQKDYRKYPYNILKCHNCQLRPLCCNGALMGCASTSLALFNNFHKVSKIKCELTKILYKDFLLQKILKSII